MTNFDNFNQVKVMVPVVISQDWDGEARRQSPHSGSGSPEPSCAPRCAPRCNPRCRPPEALELGWRKWCLFGIIAFLILIVSINLALTMWIMSIMKFNYSGMGPLKILSGGIQLSGKSYVFDSLVASSISSREGQPIVIESDQNFTVRTRSSEGNLQNRLFVEDEKFECQSKNFIVEDTAGNTLFSANPEEVTVGTESFKILGAGGAVFEGSVETATVRSEIGKDLRLESLTRSLDVSAAGGITINSGAGGISANSLKNLELFSKTGAITFNSERLIIQKLEKARPSMWYKDNPHTKRTKIYQLCVCENGRLFLASASGICETFDSELICR